MPKNPVLEQVVLRLKVNNWQSLKSWGEKSKWKVTSPKNNNVLFTLTAEYAHSASDSVCAAFHVYYIYPPNETEWKWQHNEFARRIFLGSELSWLNLKQIFALSRRCHFDKSKAVNWAGTMFAEMWSMCVCVQTQWKVAPQKLNFKYYFARKRNTRRLHYSRVIVSTAFNSTIQLFIVTITPRSHFQLRHTIGSI